MPLSLIVTALELPLYVIVTAGFRVEPPAGTGEMSAAGLLDPAGWASSSAAAGMAEWGRCGGTARFGGGGGRMTVPRSTGGIGAWPNATEAVIAAATASARALMCLWLMTISPDWPGAAFACSAVLLFRSRAASLWSSPAA